MVLTYFKPLFAKVADPVGCALSQLAFPLDGRLPEPLVRLLKKLD
jgi:hypothetical protein